MMQVLLILHSHSIMEVLGLSFENGTWCKPSLTAEHLENFLKTSPSYLVCLRVD